MTTVVLVLVIAAFYAIATGIDSRRNANRVIAEVLAAEEREIERRRVAGRQAGVDAGWHGSSIPAFQPLGDGSPVTNTGNGSIKWWQR